MSVLVKTNIKNHIEVHDDENGFLFSLWPIENWNKFSDPERLKILARMETIAENMIEVGKQKRSEEITNLLGLTNKYH